MVDCGRHGLALLVVLLAGCSDDAAPSAGTSHGGPSQSEGDPNDLGGNNGAAPPSAPPNIDGQGAGGSGGTAGLPPTPPEEEIESSFEVPVATGRHMWSANPDSGLVALVDVHTLEVRVLQGGLEPTFLAAVPAAEGHSAALVINVGSDDATFFDVDDQGEVSSHTVPIHTGANAWSVSASGRWAIAWTDAARSMSPDATEAFQDITVVDLQSDPPVPTRLSVGYRPSQIVFDEAEERALAVTEPAISVITLGDAPELARDHEFTSTDDGLRRDVSITPDGALALIRTEESAALTLLQLATGEETVVELPAAITDLDLARGGELALAVLRETSQVALVDIPAVLDDPNAVELVSLSDATIGSVSVSLQGDQAFLFTNAVESDHLAILGLDAHDQRGVSLKAPVRAVFSAPTGEHAIALLQPGAESTRAGAFAVVPATAERSPRIQGSDAPPVAVAMVSDPVARGLVTVSDPASGLHGVYVVRLQELQVDFQRLLSPPIATGIAGDEGIGFVAQRHPEGRISFVDLELGTVRTLTGFELGAQVIDGD